MHAAQLLLCPLILWTCLYRTAFGFHKACGQSAEDGTSEILPTSGLGNTNSTQGEWPWMAAIRRRDETNNFKPWCSGFLIDKRHVLSVAQCFDDKNNNIYRVGIGNINQNEADEYRIIRIVIHPGYRKGLFYDDIAILTLDRDVNFPNFSPVCLPDENSRRMISSNRNATAAGWGTDKPNGEISIYLKHLSGVIIVRNQECQRAFRQLLSRSAFRSQFPQGVRKNFLCAGSFEGGRDVCAGDSGGPLMIKDGDRWFAVGITSIGYSCGTVGMPDGYTNVSHYLGWIKENTREACGQSAEDGTSEILPTSRLGNTNSTQGEWPWMAAIMKRLNSKNFDTWCSGFLIDKRHVLSAARCFQDKIYNSYRVGIGNINQVEADKYRITRIVIHPGHKEHSFYNDIAILTLDREVNFPNFSPVCLPDENIRRMVLTNRNATAAGWGTDKPNGEISIYLHHVSGLRIVRNQVCQRAFRQRYPESTFRSQFPQSRNSFLCVEFIEGGPGFCPGGFGGPLMIKDGNQWFAVGVISFGYACDDFGMPGGYTNVSHYLGWIKKNTKEVCGQRNSILPVRNIPNNAPEGAWPWMVAIRKQETSGSYTFWCSGFLIDRRHVVTVTHAFHSRSDLDQYRARIGNINQNKAEEYRITRIAVHEDYTNDTFYDDIAVLTLDREVNFENYSPVCLPDGEVKTMDLSGISATIAGWPREKPSTYLKQSGDIQIIDNQRCQKIFIDASHSSFPIGISKGMLCAGYMDGRRHICEFPSGSALMIKNKNQWYAVGIVSFGLGCSARLPDGYTRVSHYLDWIREQINE